MTLNGWRTGGLFSIVFQFFRSWRKRDIFIWPLDPRMVNCNLYTWWALSSPRRWSVAAPCLFDNHRKSQSKLHGDGHSTCVLAALRVLTSLFQTSALHCDMSSDLSASKYFWTWLHIWVVLVNAIFFTANDVQPSDNRFPLHTGESISIHFFLSVYHYAPPSPPPPLRVSDSKKLKENAIGRAGYLLVFWRIRKL